MCRLLWVVETPRNLLPPSSPEAEVRVGTWLPFAALLAVSRAAGLAHGWNVERSDGCHFWAVALEAAGWPSLPSLSSLLMDESQDVAMTQLNHRNEATALERGRTTAWRAPAH